MLFILYYYLSHFIPLSFKGEGELVLEERLRLSLTLFITPSNDREDWF
jgi:hypothetical protein